MLCCDAWQTACDTPRTTACCWAPVSMHVGHTTVLPLPQARNLPGWQSQQWLRHLCSHSVHASTEKQLTQVWYPGRHRRFRDERASGGAHGARADGAAAREGHVEAAHRASRRRGRYQVNTCKTPPTESIVRAPARGLQAHERLHQHLCQLLLCGILMWSIAVCSRCSANLQRV